VKDGNQPRGQGKRRPLFLVQRGNARHAKQRGRKTSAQETPAGPPVRPGIEPATALTPAAGSPPARPARSAGSPAPATAEAIDSIRAGQAARGAGRAAAGLSAAPPRAAAAR
jgi:hypothetical protein